MAGGRIEVAYESTSQEIKQGVENLKQTNGMVVDSLGRAHRPILADGFLFHDETSDMYGVLDTIIKTIVPNATPLTFYFQQLPVVGKEHIYLATSSNSGFFFFDIDTMTVLEYNPIQNSGDTIWMFGEQRSPIIQDGEYIYIFARVPQSTYTFVAYVYDMSLKFIKKAAYSGTTSVNITDLYPASIIRQDGASYLLLNNGKYANETYFYVCTVTYSNGIISGFSNILKITNPTNYSTYHIYGILPDPEKKYAYLILRMSNTLQLVVVKCSLSISSITWTPVANGVTWAYSSAGTQNLVSPTYPLVRNGTTYTIAFLGNEASSFIFDYSTLSPVPGTILVNSSDNTKALAFDYKNKVMWGVDQLQAQQYLGTVYNYVSRRRIIFNETSNKPYLQNLALYYPVRTNSNTVPNDIPSPVFSSRTIFKDGMPYTYAIDRLTLNSKYFTKLTYGKVIMGYEEVL